MTTESLDRPGPTPDSKPEGASRKEMLAILGRAEKGDASCLSDLRALLDGEPMGDLLVERYGSPADWLKKRLIEESADKNLAMKEAMDRKLSRLRSELSGPSPSPLESLLVERAVLCWLTVHIYEIRYANTDRMTLPQAEFKQRLIDKAHSRFLSAIKTLATIRKLALPALQVNIGTNQVNVA